MKLDCAHCSRKGSSPPKLLGNNPVRPAADPIALISWESCSESEEELHQLSWIHKQELKDSLFDMYRANPKVNEELKQRLPSPVKHHCSETTPQLGSSLGETTSATSQSQSLSKALEEKLIKVSKTPRPREGLPLRPPLPPPVPGPVAAEVRIMEEERRYPQREQDITETASSPVHTPHVSSAGSAALRHAHEDQGKSKVTSDCKKQVPVLDKEKNISFLLKELDSLRDLNKKLQDKLALKEKELETKLLDSQLQEAELEGRASERAAALVEEIYKAQRERDQAVMARLRLANEERDEALLRAKKLQEATLELENIKPEESDVDLEELLNRVNSADSALAIEQSGAAIIEQIQRARERRSQITSEEMKAVIEERDTAITRCKRLEQELIRVKEPCHNSANSTRHLAAQNNRERASKLEEELQEALRERDKALVLSRTLEEELQTLHSVLQHQTDETCPDSPVTSNQSQSRSQIQPLLYRLQQLTSEHQSAQTQLCLAQEREREANEKVQRLERLVEVLRKKVGTGSVRKVI
ncbi:mirror-image polydactyly gene 1 protein [Rhinichthys klamathensis goyatoka]|uniref:mirror-image polydactyly gene 1 protein n=1 Tax=Rhinichthys klamathensis goyatoka TaxID=3034132 RepID=UPI0024B56C1F|nr:mirror-image polydactyly gene 1 protein [Rhinichthys klamathensis goyatoka]